jgi:hypothetical protein
MRCPLLFQAGCCEAANLPPLFFSKQTSRGGEFAAALLFTARHHFHTPSTMSFRIRRLFRRVRNLLLIAVDC